MTQPGWYPDPSGAPGQRYFDGQNWTDQRAAGQQPQPQVVYVTAPKKKPIWPWVLLAIFVVIFLAFGACVAFVGSVANEVANEMTESPTATVDPTDGPPQTWNNGPDFPGKQPNDTAVESGGSVTSDNVTMTSSPLSAQEQFGNTYLCTAVTIQNNGNEQVRFNTLFDWKMQDPSGTSRTATVAGTDNFLSAGEVAPGGTASGDVCFETPPGATPGTYVVLFDPTFRFSSDRIGWINLLQ